MEILACFLGAARRDGLEFAGREPDESRATDKKTCAFGLLGYAESDAAGPALEQ